MVSPFFVYNPNMLRGVLPHLRDVFFISILMACMLLGPRMLNVDSDLGRHLTLGAYMLETRAIPTQDILSSTKNGAPRPPYEWLSQVVLALADRWLGLGGVVLATAIAIATAFGLALADAMERSHNPVLSLLLTTLAAAASSLHWLTRPHVVSFLFFALWIVCLERVRRGDRMPTWVFPAIMLVWANAHGGFVLGFLAWAAYAGGWLVSPRRQSVAGGSGMRLLLVGTTSLVASVITPDSWHNWEAVLQNRSPYILSRTAETLPPDFSSMAVWPYVVLLALTLIGFLFGFRKLLPAHVALLGMLGVASLATARNIPFFAIAAAPILTIWIGEGLHNRPRWSEFEGAIWRIDGGLIGVVWPAVLVAATAGWLFSQPTSSAAVAYRFDPNVFPVAAADWIEAHPPTGNMFNDFNWGGYLLYRLWPRERVFIDSQTDFYGEDLTQQYEQVTVAAAGWQELLDRHQIDWLIVPLGAPVAQAAEESSHWRVDYEDNVAVILVHR